MDCRALFVATNGQGGSTDAGCVHTPLAVQALLSRSKQAVSEEHPQVVRKLAIGIVILFGGLCLAIVAGVRYNGTSSLPKGFYVVVHKRLQKGDLVFVKLPQAPVYDMARRRSYLDIGWSPAHHLLKRLVAVGGDRVTVNALGVEVNGVTLANSVPLTEDAAGRSLQFYPLQNYTLGPDEILIMSESPASFDSRYFGPVRITMLESVVIPVLTW
jgi:conjugative transfer signal peptidase TraF